jgi:hypothetical protein
MALRNQPYLPLYVQDYLTDEKLNACCPATQGVYIKIMCILHKSDEYGKILLRQKDKQNDSKTLNFAHKLAKLLPFTTEDIMSALTELTDEGVMIIDGDTLYQKRMVKDGEISTKRALAASGNKKNKDKNNNFVPTKPTAKPVTKNEQNTEYENEYDNENNINTKESNIKQIFDHWNSKNLIVHRELNSDMEKAINKRLEEFNPETITTAIDRYKTILEDKQYFFEYRWSLTDFLNRKNGITSFMDEGSKWVDYQVRASPKAPQAQNFTQRAETQSIKCDNE